ncbi:MAG: NADPH-dependent FMN reductase [Nannocystaceae bacterium]
MQAVPRGPARVLIIRGSRSPESNLHAMARIAEQAAVAAGGDVKVVCLSELDLPVMNSGDPLQAELPAVVRVRETASWAEGFILATPEYHGNMSGALKNWFDFLYNELAGKFAGVLACTGGGGGDMSITAVKRSFNWCHGFTLPFHAAARARDFKLGELENRSIHERIERIAHDVVRYAPLIRGTFETARQSGRGIESGVAGMH